MPTSCLSEIEKPTLATLRTLQELKDKSVRTAQVYHELRNRLTALEATLAAEQAADKLTASAFALLQSEVAQLTARTKASQLTCEDAEREWANLVNAESARQAQVKRTARREALEQELAVVHSISSPPNCYSRSLAEIERAAIRKSAILAELAAIGI